MTAGATRWRLPVHAPDPRNLHRHRLRGRPARVGRGRPAAAAGGDRRRAGGRADGPLPLDRRGGRPRGAALDQRRRRGGLAGCDLAGRQAGPPRSLGRGLPGTRQRLPVALSRRPLPADPERSRAQPGGRPGRRQPSVLRRGIHRPGHPPGARRRGPAQPPVLRQRQLRAGPARGLARRRAPAGRQLRRGLAQGGCRRGHRRHVRRARTVPPRDPQRGPADRPHLARRPHLPRPRPDLPQPPDARHLGRHGPDPGRLGLPSLDRLAPGAAIERRARRSRARGDPADAARRSGRSGSRLAGRAGESPSGRRAWPRPVRSPVGSSPGRGPASACRSRRPPACACRRPSSWGCAGIRWSSISDRLPATFPARPRSTLPPRARARPRRTPPRRPTPSADPRLPGSPIPRPDPTGSTVGEPPAIELVAPEAPARWSRPPAPRSLVGA